MNIFEAGVFATNCAAGYLAGKVLATNLGPIGWLPGIPIGFLLSLGFFYGLSLLPRLWHQDQETYLLKEDKKKRRNSDLDRDRD